MKKLRSLFNYLLITGLLALVLIFFFWNTSGLAGNDLNQGGKAYYDYAPDGKYKAMMVYFQDEVASFQLVLDENEDVIYVSRFRDNTYPLVHTIWMSNQNALDAAYDYVAMSYDHDIDLPVSFYERWYAWLFMNVRNVDLDKLEMIPD